MAIKEFINVSPPETAIAQNLTVSREFGNDMRHICHSKANERQAKAQQSIDEFGME
jgi:hypothetical protein